ncbi:MAG TPA: hypothetical protein VG602_06770 [Actinomycetota bacterium]|nr:hypothetical protein [Actinomycetota bacterium]
MTPRRGLERLLAGVGGALAVLLVAVGMPLAGSVLAQEPSPPAEPQAGPTETPVPGPTGTGSPTPAPSPTTPPGAKSITDTEYLNVHIDETGAPGDAILKNWLRVRGPAGASIDVVDPTFLEDPTPTAGTPAPDAEDSLAWNVTLPDSQYSDLYYEGRVMKKGDMYMTPEGPRPLPVSLSIRYYTGPPGAETPVTPQAFSAARGPAKLVFEVTNNTRQMQEVTYSDIQTAEQMTAVVPVWTPYVVKIGPVLFPDEQFDRIESDGVESRDVEGGGTEVTWTLNLAPPDYDATQTAIAQFLVAAPEIPEMRVVAQPQYPPAKAEAVSSEEVQFQKGRRSFLYDVFGLLRSNLIALTGLFGLLDDAFANLAIPLISPEKGNREAGSFDDPNQLWALWTLAKGMEQLDRALNVLDYSLQLSRNAVKGQLATLSQMRLLLGKSTDHSAVNLPELLAPPSCLPLCTPQQVREYLQGIGTNAEELIDHILEGSIWQNIKDLESLLGCQECVEDPQPFLPEAPASVTPTCPQCAVMLSIIRLKLALFEQNLAALQKENHSNQLATFTGVSNTALSSNANDWRKFTTITFPFGLEELDDGLYQLKVNGTDLLQQAIGNKDMPNSIIWAMHVLTDGMESLSDSFHQLGSTWRYLADSVQNFGIFGVETAQNTLQLDINEIDIESAQRGATAARVSGEQPTTFMGSPQPTKEVPVDTQFVLVFSTEPPDLTTASALSSTGGKVAVGLAFLTLILALLAFARLRWHLL